MARKPVQATAMRCTNVLMASFEGQKELSPDYSRYKAIDARISPWVMLVGERESIRVLRL